MLYPLLILLLIAPFQISAQSLYTNPLTDDSDQRLKCADPGVAPWPKFASKFILACTGAGFQLYSSDDLFEWTDSGHSVIHSGSANSNGQLRTWASSGRSWAPAFAHLNGRIYSYYTQNYDVSPHGLKGAIGVSRTPFHQNLDSFDGRLTAPLISDNPAGGYIDPTYFKDKNGKHYLVYKLDGNSLSPGQDTKIMIHELDPSGEAFLSPAQEIKTGGKVLSTLVEGPELIQRGAYYYLFFSQGSYQDTSVNGYRVRVARSTHIDGPYIEDRLVLSDRPSGRFYGAGHGSIVSKNGSDFYLYHAYDSTATETDSSGNGYRYAMIDRIHWQQDGWPIIHDGHPSETPQPKPLNPQNQLVQPSPELIPLTWNDPEFVSDTATRYALDVKVGSTTHSSCVTPNTLDTYLATQSELNFNLPTTCDDGTQLSFNGNNSVRICAAKNGNFANYSICSSFHSLDASSIQFTLRRQSLSLSWDVDPGYTYSLDAIAQVAGFEENIPHCLNASTLAGSSSLGAFDGQCPDASPNESFVVIKKNLQLRICRSTNWGQSPPANIACRTQRVGAADNIVFEFD